MRSQSLFLEYILIIILAAYLTYFVYSWYESSNIYFVDILKKDDVEKRIKLLDRIIYNLASFKYAKEIVEIDVSARCLGNYTLLITKENCETNPLDLEYTGMIIESNGTYYIYSNTTGKYYLYYPIGYFVIEGCYEGFISYIINTTVCRVFCVDRCVLNVIKNETELVIE